MPLLLSRADARRVAMACHSLAHVLKGDVDKMNDPQSKTARMREVEALLKLAAMFEAHAKTPAQE